MLVAIIRLHQESDFMKQLYPNVPRILILTFVSLISFIHGHAQCTPQGDQTSYGTNNQWIGYVYQGLNFDTYRGYINQGDASSPNFDQGFGGDQVNFATNGCDVYTENFTVRYKLTKTFTNGYYDFTVGGDDGYRLSLDGGSTWIIDRWVDQSYTTTTYSIALNGTYNMVLEFYERGGQNRISFEVSASCAPVGDQNAYGSGNVWIGYMYQGNNFNAYRGYTTHGSAGSPNFDINFGGSNTVYATNGCGVQTEYFSARFRLQKSLPAGTYVFVVGGDDGYRLSLDGGSTWVINNWTAHPYTTTTYTTFLSAGTYNLVLEFYEDAGENRVSFAMSSTGTLPVKLAGFSAKAIASDKVQLNWKVSEEMNFSHYVVQRSTGGQAYTDIAVVTGQEKDVQVETAYQYTDQVTYSGQVHYRLRMVDKDGREEYSGVVTVSLNVKQGEVKIYPTVIENGSLYVETYDNMEKGSVQILDMHGRLMLQRPNITNGRNQVTLGNASLSAGSYLVSVLNGDQVVTVRKILVK